MAKRFTVEMIMNLAKAIGANPNKFMGTKTNINFLGKGPMKNPLFQEPLAGLEGATEAQLGSRETMIEAVEDAMGYLSSGKLNSIQSEILGHNLSGIKNIYNPPPLPMASVTDIAPGIEGLRRFPKESHKFFGRPLKGRDFDDIDKLMKEGYTDTRGRRWDFKAPGAGERRYNKLTGLNKPRLVENRPTEPGQYDDITKKMWGSRLQRPGAGDMAALTKALDAKTGMSRAIARQILQQDTRLKLKPEELYSLRTGKGEPLDLMRKYYGDSIANLDAFLDDVVRRPPINIRDMNIRDIATRALTEVELIPQFAEGGLADVLQVRSGYSKGRLVKSAIAILNRNKKNADYMFKASDNVSPGYARGDIKYNAELLAEQLAEDAGILYEDLGALEQTKFYGTAYDYLAKEMGQHLLQKRMLRDIGQKMVLSDFSIKGRKPNASGGLAGILDI